MLVVEIVPLRVAEMVPAVVVEIVPVLVVEMVPVFVVEIVPVFETAADDKVTINKAEHAIHLNLFIDCLLWEQDRGRRRSAVSG